MLNKQIKKFKLSKIFLLAYRGYLEDNCALRSSALTFYSLLAIVPILALIFGIAKGFGFHEVVQQELLSFFRHQEEVAQYIVTFAHNSLKHTRGGLIAGVGVVTLLWTFFKLINHIEDAFFY